MKKLIVVLLVLISVGLNFKVNAQNGWELMEPLDIQRGRLRSCAIDSMIYVFGGQGTNGVNIDSVDVYNTETNEWTDLSPMSEGLGETNVEVINDTIYIVGGWSDVNGHNQKTTNSTLAFDPEKESYLAMKDCPDATGSNASCVLNDTLYIFGGKEDFVSTDVKKGWFYDPIGDNWDTISIPDMIYPHGVNGSACVLDGIIYVIGGANALEPFYPTQAEMYDGENWAPIAEMPVPVLHHVTIIHDNKILVFGGDSGRYVPNGYATNLIQEYDPSANSWRLMQGMPFNRSAMTGEKVGNYLYLVGGYSSNDFVSSTAVSEVWRFNLDSLKVLDVTGITKTEADYFSVYPNPTKGLLHLKELGVGFHTIEIISLNGQLLYNTKVEGPTHQIDLSSFQKGLYFITVRSNDFVRTEKIIKQ